MTRDKHHRHPAHTKLHDVSINNTTASLDEQLDQKDANDLS